MLGCYSTLGYQQAAVSEWTPASQWLPTRKSSHIRYAGQSTRTCPEQGALTSQQGLPTHVCKCQPASRRLSASRPMLLHNKRCWPDSKSACLLGSAFMNDVAPVHARARAHDHHQGMGTGVCSALIKLRVCVHGQRASTVSRTEELVQHAMLYMQVRYSACAQQQ